MEFTAHAYTGEHDYTNMRQLLVDIYTLNGPSVYCSVGDLDWWRCSGYPQDVEKVWLWETEHADLAGFAWPSKSGVDLMVHPRYQALEDTILAWAEGQWMADSDHGPGPFTVYANDTDTGRIDILQRRGYAQAQHFFLFHTRSLKTAIPASSLPPGYTIRHVAGPDDVERRVDVHRDAFAPSRMTVEKHLAVMASPTYRPELDLVVVAPDDSFAAFCIVWFDEVNHMGVFEPVGCHSAHRRRGLTRALMYEGMRRLRDLGATTAHVLAHGSADAAPGLYASAGFQVIDQCRAWQKIGDTPGLACMYPPYILDPPSCK